MMDLKKDVVKPIFTGASVLLVAFIVSWILAMIGLSPAGLGTIIVSTGTVTVDAPGIIGLILVCWGIGYAVPKIPSTVDGLLRGM